MTPPSDPVSIDRAWLGARLAPAAERLGLPPLDPGAVERLARYAGLLLDWGRRMNLTGARTPETLADEHLADAMALVPHLPEVGALVDVGSGAGLPGIPLAVLRPGLEVCLLEPRERRHAFLRAALRALELDPDAAIRSRVEDWSPEPRPQIAVSRATWPLAEWLEIGRRLVRPGGRVLGLEGSEAVELPPDAERHPYRIGAGPRAVVVRRID